MANPIPLELPPRDPRRELQVRLQNAPIQHAEAILDGYEVLQGLHESGVFDILRGLMGSKDKIIEHAVETVNTPEMIRGMRNLATLIGALGKLDPEFLDALTGVIPKTIADADAQGGHPPGLLSILNKFRSEDARRSLGLTAALLENLGKALSPERKKQNEQQ